MDQIWLWVGFNVFVLLMLAADLGIFHRKAHDVSVKEAAGWSGVWVALAPVSEEVVAPAEAKETNRRFG
jgi:tellurite resistance protein TerC